MLDSADWPWCRRVWRAPDGSVLEACRSSNAYSTAAMRLAEREAPHVADAGGGAVGLTSPNAKAAARREPKPERLAAAEVFRRVDDFAIVPVDTGDVRAATDPARRCELKRTCRVRRWVSALFDFVPSVSPQGEAGGGEAAAKAPALDKARPRPVRAPTTSNTNRSRPDGSSSVTTGSPAQGAGLSPHPQPEPSGSMENREATRAAQSPSQSLDRLSTGCLTANRRRGISVTGACSTTRSAHAS
jgi:hypothetical protein